jgi:hypothetical protein
MRRCAGNVLKGFKLCGVATSKYGKMAIADARVKGHTEADSEMLVESVDKGCGLLGRDVACREIAHAPGIEGDEVAAEGDLVRGKYDALAGGLKRCPAG